LTIPLPEGVELVVTLVEIELALLEATVTLVELVTLVIGGTMMFSPGTTIDDSLTWLQLV